MMKPLADHLADEELQQFLDGRCTADETQSARAHMAVCPACKTQYAHYLLLDQGLRKALPLTITDSVVRTIAAQVQTDRYLRALTRIAAVVGPMVAALFLAAITLTLYYLLNGTGQDVLASSSSTTIAGWMNTTLHQWEQLLEKAGEGAGSLFRPTAMTTLWMILLSIAVVFFIDGALTRRRKPPARV